MQEIRLKGHINSDRTLHLSLPENAPEGPAEVIVLVEETTGHGTTEDFLSLVERLRQDVTEKKTWEEVQSIVSEERDSWD